MMYKFRILILLFIAASSISPAIAQERRLSNHSPGTLRVWPKTGHWHVVLIRNTRHHLTCLLATGKFNPSHQITYLYGILYRNKIGSLFIIDKDQSALSGNAISVIIDGVSLGSYPVTYKPKFQNAPLDAIESKLPKKEYYRIKNLFSYGSHLEFKTNGATYSSSLNGARQGILDFNHCINEVSALQGNQK